MHFPSEKGQYSLHLKCITWYKDSHSLFDYQSTKVSSTTFDFPLASKNISIYRKRQSFQVVAVEQSESNKYQNPEFQLLTKFTTQPVTDKKIKLNFSSESSGPTQKKNNENQRLNTDESNSSDTKTEQQTYLIVRKLKKENGEYLGYKLEPGQIVKLGRVEFFVSQTCIDGKITTANGKNKARVYSSRNVMKYNPLEKKSTQSTENSDEKPQCKICLEQTEDNENFLFNPCVCMGSCGTVHLDCLTQWIHFKVKKEVVGGTQHYNFQKFKCQVCKTELPMIIDVNGTHKELLPIEKPHGNYLILQGACDKEKSVIMIQNIPNQGIKLGRGHECEIRITDISVSRNHGLIKNQPDGFYIYDNKSKFGTLVRDQKMEIQISRLGQGVQIGRTVVSFELRKEQSSQQNKISKSTKGISDARFQ